MKFFTLSMNDINPRLPEAKTPARVDAYIHTNSRELGIGPDTTYPTVVLCPGGAYFFTSDREAEPIALKFFAAGYNVFTLRYSVAPDRYPTALLQVCGVIAHIRAHAAEYHVAPDKIAVCGFSAGGHLAASAGTLWKAPVVAETLGVEASLCRPDRMILCYPVITSGEFAHRGSFDNLLGPGAGKEALSAMSLETRVDGDSAPAFLWHTFSDESVPVENTLLMAGALRRAGVPFELHIYPEGAHGMSLGSYQSLRVGAENQIFPLASSWMGLCIAWLDGQFGNRQ